MVILIILGAKLIKSEIHAFKLAKPLQVYNLCLALLTLCIIWSTVLLQKLVVTQSVRKFPMLYGL